MHETIQILNLNMAFNYVLNILLTLNLPFSTTKIIFLVSRKSKMMWTTHHNGTVVN